MAFEASGVRIVDRPDGRFAVSAPDRLARPHGGHHGRCRCSAVILARDGVVLPVLLIAVGALVLRVVDLGARAMHHDESLHATFAWYLAEGRGYEHNPLMHGPLLFHTVAGVFKVAGDGDIASRLPMAVAGAVLVATPLLFPPHPRAGRDPRFAATLLALSPVLLYFSRFSRNDVIAVLWTVLIVAAVWRYRADGRSRWLVLAAAALALGFATKETAYIALASVLLYLNADAHGRAARPVGRPRLRARGPRSSRCSPSPGSSPRCGRPSDGLRRTRRLARASARGGPARGARHAHAAVPGRSEPGRARRGRRGGPSSARGRA